MGIEDITDVKTLRRLASITADAIGVMQEIINGLEGPIPDHLLEKLDKLADEAERLKNFNGEAE